MLYLNDALTQCIIFMKCHQESLFYVNSAPLMYCTYTLCSIFHSNPFCPFRFECHSNAVFKPFPNGLGSCGAADKVSPGTLGW